jgi:hypothetical protein
MAGTDLATIGKSIKSSFNHSASVVADSSAISSASIVDLVKINYVPEACIFVKMLMVDDHSLIWTTPCSVLW